MERFGIFNVHLIHFMAIWHIFTAIWYILWSFRIFWYFVPRKIWQPCVQAKSRFSFHKEVGNLF
jgi:hypothetical protein